MKKFKWALLLVVTIILISGADKPIISQAAYDNPFVWGTSVDGNYLTCMAYGNGIYVAVGGEGSVKTSTDGYAWTRRTLPFDAYLSGVVWNGSFFTAVGNDGVIATSYDGVNWSKQQSGLSSYISGAAWDGNKLIAAGEWGTILTSSDGVNWSTKTNIAQATFFGVAYNGTTYVAAGYGGEFATSTDGVTWTKHILPASRYMYNVTWCNGRFWAGGYGEIYCSQNGTDWNVIPMLPEECIDCIVWGNDKYLAVGENGNIFSSTDGSSWSMVNSGTSTGIQYIIWDGSKYIASGYSGLILVSADGEQWDNVSPSMNGELHFFNSVIWDSNKFVTVGDSIYTSSDGLDWTKSQLDTDTVYLHGVTLGDKLVAVGDSGKILTSSDGLSWTSRQSGTSLDLYSVAWNGKMYVAVGAYYPNYIILTSADGINWSRHSSSNWLHSVASDGNKFVAVGEYGVILNSTDGVTWTSRNSGVSTGISSVKWCGGRFVAADKGGRILISKDGILWDNSTYYGGSNGIASALWLGDHLVGVGGGGLVMATHDGSFSYCDRVTSESLNDMAWNGSRLIAVGWYNTIIYCDTQDIVTPSNLEVNGPDSSGIPVTQNISVKFNVIARNIYGELLNSVKDYTWSVYDLNDNPVNTLSIDSNGNLTVSSSAQRGTYKVKVILNSNTALTASRTITLKSSNTSISSNLFTIDDAGSVIQNVPYGTPVSQFLDSMVVADWAVMKLYYSGGIVEVTSGDVLNGMILKVAAEDGVTVRTYTIIVKEYINFIENGNFDQDPNTYGTWGIYSNPDKGVASFYWDNEVYRGSSGCSVSIEGSDIEAALVNSVDIQPGNTYAFSAWGKTQNVIASEAGAGSYIYIGQYDANGVLIEGTEHIWMQDGSYDWSRAYCVFTAAPNAKSVFVILSLDGAGKAWYDDICLNALISTGSSSEGVTSINISGAEALTVPDAGSVTATYTSAVKDQNGNQLQNESVSWFVYDSDYKPVTSVSIDNNGVLTVSSNASTGAYIIKAVSASKPTVSCVMNVQLTANSLVNSNTAIFDKNTQKQADVQITANLRGNTLVSVKNGSVNLIKDTNYTVSGNVITIKKSYLASLPVGNAALVLIFSAGSNVSINITIADTTAATTPSGDGSGAGGGGFYTGNSDNESVSNKAENGVMIVEPTKTQDTASFTLSYDAYKLLTGSAALNNGITKVTLDVKDTGLSKFEIKLDKAIFQSSTNNVMMTIKTPMTSITVPSGMFTADELQRADSISILISCVDKFMLSELLQSVPDDTPIVNISITVNGSVIEWNNSEAPVTVSIPYTLKNSETSDNITAFYIFNNESLVNMQAFYDQESKAVIFTTTHLSSFLVKKNEITFKDLAGFESYSKYIESMAAKGIIEGVGKTLYAPGKLLTRAEFATLLVKMLKMNTSDSGVKFIDVKAGAWYVPYINAAYKAGLIKGLGLNKFAPDETITVQDAALILARALKYKGLTITEGSLAGINDKNDISMYAREGVGVMVLNGLIPLDKEGNLNPKATVNRAASAQYIYNIFNFK